MKLQCLHITGCRNVDAHQSENVSYYAHAHRIWEPHYHYQTKLRPKFLTGMFSQVIRAA